MKCLLTTPRAQFWIQNGRPARILHIFKDVINLADDFGHVISISSPAIDPGPFSIIMEESFLDSLQNITLYEKINLNPLKNIIRIGDFCIDTDQAAIWDSIPQWAILQDAGILTHEIELYIPPVIEPNFHGLLSAIAKEDYAGARRLTTAIAGLGEGLTPAGDDFLMGLIFALWVWKPQSVWVELIPEWAAPNTTTLSAAHLHAASFGEAHSYWHNLVNRRPGAVDQILSVGDSSGRFAWSGFVHAFGRFHKT